MAASKMMWLVIRRRILPSLTQTRALSAVAQTNYRFTLDSSSKLSPAQRQQYEDKGFLVVKNLISHQKLDRFRERFVEICDNKSERLPGMIIMKDIGIAKQDGSGEHIITKIQDWCYDDRMFEYCCLPEIVEYVECFTGPNMMAMHTMLINKPPDPGTKSSRHPLHQDLYYFPFRPADRIVCSWTAMEPITRENGCLVVLPGTHKGELLEHGYPEWEGGVNKFYHGIKNYKEDESNRVHLEMEKGDTVFFHPILIHGSGMNRTAGYRKAISCHYASSDFCEYIDIKGTYQQVLADEVLNMVKKRRGIELEDFTEVWRIKSREVRGVRNKL